MFSIALRLRTKWFTLRTGDTPLPVSFGRAAMEAKTTHVGYSANDKHMSDQSLRLLPSKFTVDNLVSVVGGLGPVDLSER